MPSLPTHRGWTLLASCAVLLAAPRYAPADDRVQVTILAILATDQNKDVDPQLKCVAQKVQKLSPDLTGFHVARTCKRSLEVGKASRFTLVDSVPLTVTVEQGADKNNRVGLKVKPPELGEISYLSCCGKFFPIVTRYHTKNKERLIIAIMVEPCRKKCE